MKIWLYYAKSGGGHKAPAEALARDLKKLYPETETKLVDLAEKASVFFRESIESGYVLLSHHIPWLYAFIYKINNNSFVIKIECLLANFFVKPSIKAQLVVDSPDAIIATHFLVSPIRAALRELKRSTPIFIVVTDPFSVSPVWFCEKDLNYVVYSDKAKQIGVACGVPGENICVFKQVINHELPKLNDEQKTAVKNKLELDPAKKIILMIGGANGLPKGERVFELMVKSKPEAEVVAVLGTNKKQQENLRKISERYHFGKVLGWVEDLPSLMAVSDAIVTKAGAGVVWESLLLNKPLIIANYIYGQEKGTMEFVVSNGYGWHLKRPEEIVEKINEVVKTDIGEKISKEIEKQRFGSGNSDIVHHIYRKITEVKA